MGTDLLFEPVPDPILLICGCQIVGQDIVDGMLELTIDRCDTCRASTEARALATQEPARVRTLDDLHATLLAMAKLEGEAWLERQLDSLDASVSEYDVGHALRRRAELIAEGGSNTVAIQIYGEGCCNRWFMTVGTGEVTFSASHALYRIDTARAALFGFRLV